MVCLTELYRRCSVTDDEFDDILNEAEKQTNDKFKDRIAGLTKLTPEELEKIAPTVADKDALMKLMDIVHSAADANDKKAAILANIEMFAGIVLNIAGKMLI